MIGSRRKQMDAGGSSKETFIKIRADTCKYGPICMVRI